MYKKINLFVIFVIITTLISAPLAVLGEVIADPIDYDVRLTAHSYVSGNYFNVDDAEPDRIYQVALNSAYALGSAGISFGYDDTSAFVPGATYVLTFVYVTPQHNLTLINGTKIGTLTGSVTGEQDIILGTNATVTSNFDRTVYPDVFNFDYLNYNTQAYLVTYSFELQPGDSYFSIDFDFDISSSNYTFWDAGYAYVKYSTSDEEFNYGILLNINYFLNNINRMLGDILFNMTNGFNTVNSSLTSLSTITGNGFDNVLTSLSGIRSELSAGFAALGSKLDTLNQKLDNVQQGNVDNVIGDINDADQGFQDSNNDLNDSQSSINNTIGDLNNQFESNEQFQQDFLGRYNLSELTNITDNIYAAVRGYAQGIQWVGAFFGQILTFEPFAYLLYLTVFINLLFVMANVVGRSGAHAVRRSDYAAFNEYRRTVRGY